MDSEPWGQIKRSADVLGLRLYQADMTFINCSEVREINVDILRTFFPRNRLNVRLAFQQRLQTLVPLSSKYPGIVLLSHDQMTTSKRPDDGHRGNRVSYTPRMSEPQFIVFSHQRLGGITMEKNRF